MEAECKVGVALRLGLSGFPVRDGFCLIFRRLFGISDLDMGFCLEHGLYGM